jgi:hypothetical protein
MSIGTINTFPHASSVYHSGSVKHAGAAAESPGNPKDTATISNAAKELAARNSGTSSKEEATESASTRMQEQLAGTE